MAPAGPMKQVQRDWAVDQCKAARGNNLGGVPGRARCYDRLFVEWHTRLAEPVVGCVASLTYGGAELSASIFVRQMLKPSIMASKNPPMAAEREAARQPPRAANTPPVNAPDAIEFHGSSFRLIQTKVQSKVEKSPPQTAKLPARSGDGVTYVNGRVREAVGPDVLVCLRTSKDRRPGSHR